MIINTLLITISILATGAIILVEDWRYRLALVAIIELIGFILIVQIWPIALASVKLISGWMGIALLATTFSFSSSGIAPLSPISSRVFRLMLVTFGWLLVLVSAERFNEWLPISYTNLFIGMVFFISGMIYLALRMNSIDTVLGLLIFFEGFDVIYSSLEGSALITGIFGIIIISICLTGSYLEGGFKFGGTE
jgi:hypothetical protein